MYEQDFKARTALLETGYYPASLNPRFLRRYLIRKHGEKCARCGWNEQHPTTGRVPVELEHIDGDWQNTSIANLVLLCPNCHALTTTYRGLNRGKGRSKRLGGRLNPVRDKVTKGKRFLRPLASFPLPRKLENLVEAVRPST